MEPRTDYSGYDPMKSWEIHQAEDFDEEISFDDLERIDSISHVHSDDELELVIKELLRNSKKIHADDITVTVDNCNVTLSGTVPSQEERDYACSVVKLVHGVGEVHPELMVKLNPGITPGDIGRDDPRI